MQCLMADIAEDVIVGVNYIKPLQGGFATVGNLSFFRLAINRRPKLQRYWSRWSGRTRPAPSTLRSMTVPAAHWSRPSCVTLAKPSLRTTQAQPPQ